MVGIVGLLLTVSAQAQRTATAVPTVINGFVVSITVTDGGAGYTTPPSVTINGGNGSGASASATVLNGVVDKVIVKNAGSDYTGTPVVTIAAPPSPKPPFSDGLVAFYPFNGNANDESGNGNNGIINGAVLGTDRFGRLSKSYSFSAYPQSIDTSAATGFAVGTSDFSVSLWMSPSGLSNDHQIVLCNGGVNQFQLDLWPTTTGTTAPIDFITGGHYGPSADVHTADVSWVPNRWYNLQVVRSHNTVTLYRDSLMIGQNQTANGNDAPLGSRNLRFGLGVPPQLHQFHGQLDDVRIYNRALSDQEVKDLYRYESPQPPWVSIEVETVRVTMHVTPAKRYQLESSSDLKSWSKVGDVILAGSSEIPLTLNVLQVGQFFRINEVQ